jgi:sterol desaturase/sphingolipid hydroxylase (fatty acid hydroxylase superfamily)
MQLVKRMLTLKGHHQERKRIQGTIKRIHKYTISAFQWISALSCWFLLFILEDFAFYIEHRVDHFCRIFWAVHVTHHSSDDFNLTTGFRSSVFQPVYRFFYFIPIALMGFNPLDIIFMYAITQTYGILVHTQYVKKMPKWFEYVMNTPSHHRVHHGIDVEYLDTNYAGVMIIWDRIFGSFKAEGARPHYGLTKQIESYNPVKIAFYEWVQIVKDLSHTKNVRNIWGYLMGPPGWSHDGSRMTVAQMRAENQKQTQNTGKDGIEN